MAKIISGKKYRKKAEREKVHFFSGFCAYHGRLA